jgi:energy-coupling factor transporter ATP-binding protein EcfA2
MPASPATAMEPLYGRKEQQKVLCETFDRIVVAAEGSTPSVEQDPHGEEAPGILTLITGPSGTGKTALAQALANHAAERIEDSTFITGKFDQLLKPESYYPIKAAMNEYFQTLLQRQGEALDDFGEAVAEKIRETFGADVDLFSDQFLPCQKSWPSRMSRLTPWNFQFRVAPWKSNSRTRPCRIRKAKAPEIRARLNQCYPSLPRRIWTRMSVSCLVSESSYKPFVPHNDP